MENISFGREDAATDRPGRFGGDKPGLGPGGQCVCPNCGTTVPHDRAEPCNNKKCPKCGSPMTRK